MKKTLVAFAAVLLIAPVVCAQQIAETMQVTVVEVPVTVVDRDGNAVRGLTAANFELLEDGKRVPIEYFEALDMTTLTAAGADKALPPAATRHFLLLFDLANSVPATIIRAGEAAKQFVQTQLGERDLASVATFNVDNGARMITNFTRNRDLILKAIDSLGEQKYFKAGDPLMLTADLIDPTVPGPKSPGPGHSDIDAAHLELTSEHNNDQQATQNREMRSRLYLQLADMGRVARTLDRLKGQKQIILLSEGFDATLVVGTEDRTSKALKDERTGATAARDDREIVATREVWNIDNEKRYGRSHDSAEIHEMAELFRRSDVVLHAIDIKGLRGGSQAELARGAKSTIESLFLITAPTGGTVFKNANELSENFARLMKQQEVVYLLGFKSKTAGEPGTFHSLKVKTVNAKGIARVSHRTGYYEAAPLTDLERALTVAEILMNDAAANDAGIRTTAAMLPGVSDDARVPVVVEIPGPKLLETLPGNSAKVDLFVYAFDKNSQVADFMHQRMSIDVAKAGPAIRANGLRFLGTLRLPAGSYAVKTVVRVEESGLLGVDRQNVDVPSFAKAAVMPPMFFTEPGGWATVSARRNDADSYPFSFGETRYMLQPAPEVTASGDYKVALFLYQLPAENLSVTPSASFPADMKLLERTDDEDGLIRMLFNFKPQSIPAGNHELRFDVKAKDGTQTVVTLPFRVQ